MAAEVATRKVNASAYGLKGRWATVTTLADSDQGRDKRGICAHKRTRGAKRAKKQNTGIKGAQPQIARTRWGWV